MRKLSAQPAHNLGLHDRGLLKPGYFADVVVFDPETVTDHATFEKPQQFATGVEQVLVNGELVLKDGEPTGAHGRARGARAAAGRAGRTAAAANRRRTGPGDHGLTGLSD